jgi:hypothetical protein
VNTRIERAAASKLIFILLYGELERTTNMGSAQILFGERKREEYHHCFLSTLRIDREREIHDISRSIFDDG